MIYRIKALEWDDCVSYVTNKKLIHLRIYRPYNGSFFVLEWRRFYEPDQPNETFDSLELAKARAQEIHESEMLKYLVPVEEEELRDKFYEEQLNSIKELRSEAQPMKAKLTKQCKKCLRKLSIREKEDGHNVCDYCREQQPAKERR